MNRWNILSAGVFSHLRRWITGIQIHFDNLTPRQVFLNARLPDGLTVPAGWAVEFGLGRAVFLGPGHSDSAMDNPQYARLLRNSARWAAGREVDNS